MRKFQNRKIYFPNIRIDKTSLILWISLLGGFILGCFFYSFYLENYFETKNIKLWDVFLIPVLNKGNVIRFFILRILPFLFFFILGTSSLGYPFVILGVAFLSFEKGIILTGLFSGYGFQGFLLCFLCLIPLYAVYLLLFLRISKVSFKFSVFFNNFFSKGKRLRTDEITLDDYKIRFLVFMGIYFIFLCFEYFVTPVLLGLFL